MIPEQGLYSVLSGASGLTALVQSRISASKALQRSVLPCVTYTQSGCAPVYNHDGIEDLRDPLYQIDSWGRTYDEARAVSEQVLQALLAADSPPVFWALIEDDGTSTYESDTQIHRCLVQARIWYRP